MDKTALSEMILININMLKCAMHTDQGIILHNQMNITPVLTFPYPTRNKTKHQDEVIKGQI